MFLNHIKIQDFKCLGDIELHFERHRNWTLLLGENGMGKSNLLKAIALVTCGSNSLGELLGDINQWIKIGKTKCTISAEIETQQGETRHISLIVERGDNLSKVLENNKTSLRFIDAAIEKADRNYFVLAYGASRRLSNDQHQNGTEKNRSSRTAHVKSLFDSSVPLNALNSWIIDLDYRSGAAGLELVSDTLLDFLPDVSFSRIDKDLKKALFKTVDAEVPLDQLSDGYQIMAAWIGDLLYRITETFGDYKSPLEARGLLLVDEIDLHLHPKWQRKLYEFISQKLPNFQIIATTHSALTAQQADEHELYALKRNSKQQIEIIPFIGTPNTMRINQMLMSPIFGLNSDESKQVEQTKDDYRKLKAKANKREVTAGVEMDQIAQKLQSLNALSPIHLIGEKEMDLLNRIERNLNKPA